MRSDWYYDNKSKDWRRHAPVCSCVRCVEGKSKDRFWRNFWRKWYWVAIVLGVVAIVLGVGILFWVLFLWK